MITWELWTVVVVLNCLSWPCLLIALQILSFKLNVGHFPHLADLVTRINYNYFYMSEKGNLLTVPGFESSAKAGKAPTFRAWPTYIDGCLLLFYESLLSLSICFMSDRGFLIDWMCRNFLRTQWYICPSKGGVNLSTAGDLSKNCYHQLIQRLWSIPFQVCNP